MEKKVGIIGYGYVGKAYHKLFPDAVIYDEPLKIGSREEINSCDMAIVCVPTDLKAGGSLNTTIVEDVVSWLETPLILIKSALNVGTTDFLKDKYKKRICVSVEMVGEGKYFVPFWKCPHPENPTYHNFLIIGGSDKDTEEMAEIVWAKMSPDINIHQVSAIEAEICKLMENTWGALKVSFSNTIYDICEAYGANFIKVLQAWGSDGRTEKFHMRTISYKRGWKSKCWDKDIPALVRAGRVVNCNVDLLEGLISANKSHLKE